MDRLKKTCQGWKGEMFGQGGGIRDFSFLKENTNRVQAIFHNIIVKGNAILDLGVANG